MFAKSEVDGIKSSRTKYLIKTHDMKVVVYFYFCEWESITMAGKGRERNVKSRHMGRSKFKVQSKEHGH